VINEALQWAVLLALSVFVFGLTRQLGHFLIINRADRSASNGPDLGKAVPGGLLHDAERDALRALMRERSSDVAAVAAVAEHCPGCRTLLDELADNGAPEGMPLVLLAASASDEFRSRLTSLSDVTVIEEQRIKAGGIGLTPFVFILDEQFNVVHKEAAMTVHGTLRSWRRTGDRNDTLAVHLRDADREQLIASTNGGASS
jgi:hypothetical protein